MHNLLLDLFKKRGIESAAELTPEEKTDFNNWDAILSKEELTTADIKEFCQSQCEVIKQKWSDYNVSQDKKSELLPYFSVYNSLLAVMDAPKKSREALEKHLTNILNS